MILGHFDHCLGSQRGTQLSQANQQVIDRPQSVSDNDLERENASHHPSEMASHSVALPLVQVRTHWMLRDDERQFCHVPLEHLTHWILIPDEELQSTPCLVCHKQILVIGAEESGMPEDQRTKRFMETV